MRSIHKIIAVFAFICILTAIAFSLEHQTDYRIHIMDSKSGMDYWTCMVSAGDSFTLEYIHSVHKTPVTDYFSIQQNKQMRLYQTAFATFGAGMPYETKDIIGYRENAFIFKVQDKEFRQIQLHAVPFADHRISLLNQTIAINDLISGPTLLTIYVD